MKSGGRLRRRYRAIGNATKAQKAYHDAICELGCVACILRGNDAACGFTRVHHRTTGDLHGQKQLGHSDVVALGDWHHQGVLIEGETVDSMLRKFGPSLHHHKCQFLDWIAEELGERSTAALQRYQDDLRGVRAP